MRLAQGPLGVVLADRANPAVSTARRRRFGAVAACDAGDVEDEQTQDAPVGPPRRWRVGAPGARQMTGVRNLAIRGIMGRLNSLVDGGPVVMSPIELKRCIGNGTILDEF